MRALLAAGTAVVVAFMGAAFLAADFVARAFVAGEGFMAGSFTATVGGQDSVGDGGAGAVTILTGSGETTIPITQATITVTEATTPLPQAQAQALVGRMKIKPCKLGLRSSAFIGAGLMEL